MLISIAELLGVKREKFETTGAFNAILGADSKLFVDPALIFKTDIPEFNKAKDKITEYFNKILILVNRSTFENDKFWNEAVKLMTIPEVKGISIGYSNESSDGNGIGLILARKIIKDAKLIINESKNDLYFFELLGLFEKGLGADRISDMIIYIMRDNFIKYSKRICRELKVDYEKKCRTSENTEIIILPQKLLTNLPHSDRVFRGEVSDEKVREVLNVTVGRSWKDAFTKEGSKAVDKSYVLEEFSENAKLFDAFIKEYNNTQAHNYNFKSDPQGEFMWYHETQKAISESKVSYKQQANTINKKKKLSEKVDIMCDIFKDLVENNGLDSLFYKNNVSDVRDAKNEKAIQSVFYGVCYFFCTQNNIDLTPESNTGSGPVDFKCSTGNDKVLIEVKKSVHSKLDHGYFVQLEKYKKSEKTEQAVFLVIILDGDKSNKNISKFNAKLLEREEDEKKSKVVYVNAQKKKSASKM
ncbi:hypothetical protein [Carnobacterium divergens]|uniref:hypothetical protein n=1 Tax=Carnobacterium divergens TaxID=2748 RepID=UPI00107180EB|nr:hypothetical protein [Carnobacterium divergens]TFI72244.1 hypothetical protein CKN81_08860 [Carnobacterium divergens]